MTRIRFNHVYSVMLLMSIVGALCIPPSMSGHKGGLADNLLAPLSLPIRSFGSWARSRLSGSAADGLDVHDPSVKPEQTVAQLKAEKEELLARVAYLTAQMKDLQKQYADTDVRIDLQPLCDRFSVHGTDAGGRQSLLITGARSGLLHNGMAVIYHGMLAGRISGGSMGAFQVQLINAPYFVASGRFGRYRKDADGRSTIAMLDTSRMPSAKGNGKGLVVKNLPMKEVVASGLTAGDCFVFGTDPLDEHEGRDSLLEGLMMGRIESITAAKEALFADIFVRPEWNVNQMDHVLVKTRR